MKKSKFLPLAILAALAPAFTACVGDGDDTITLGNLVSANDDSVADDNGENVTTNTLGIPDDSFATSNPTVDEATTTLSTPTVTVKTQDGYAYVSLDMTGVWDNVQGDWLQLRGTGAGSSQNVWVEVDGNPKGIDVYNVSEGDGSQTSLLDVVFLVDNSGSMYEEANAVARDILSWVTELEASGLSLRVGCVGYGDSSYAIDGALNMTDVTSMKTYLERASGTSRTLGFGGDDASTLQALACSGNYNNGSYNECGAVALWFATDNFSFRSGANRVYVNFTDEPNQPNGIEKWSVEYINPDKTSNWGAGLGTIHTVFSDTYTAFSQTYLYREWPWLLSEYTGGTTFYTNSSFSGVTLSQLPVTGAMSNSYIIRFSNIEQYLDGQPHTIHITVLTPDGNVAAEKTISVVFEPASE